MKILRPRLLPLAALVFVTLAGAGAASEPAATRAVPSAPFDARSAQAALERGGLAPADQLPLMRALADAALKQKDFAAAIAWAQRFVAAGGTEADVRTVLADALHGKGDYANAARELQWEVQGAERAGKAPGEDRLLLLKDCYAHLNDNNALAWSLEKLVTWYPKRAYWGELLDRTQDRPDFGQPLALDVNRLRFLTGSLHGPAEYVNLANQAQRSGFPAEALRVLDRGFAEHVLGSGPESAHQRELRSQFAKEAAQQADLLAQPATERVALDSKTGDDLVRLGFAYVTQGKAAKGLALIEQGVQKPLLDKRPQYARLHLGIAHLQAGQRAQAIAVFANVGGRHGAADLARLWGIYARNLS